MNFILLVSKKKNLYTYNFGEWGGNERIYMWRGGELPMGGQPFWRGGTDPGGHYGVDGPVITVNPSDHGLLLIVLYI